MDDEFDIWFFKNFSFGANLFTATLIVSSAYKFKAMHDDLLTGAIIEQAIEIHRQLGPGLFESVYEEVLAYQLSKVGMEVKRQVEIPVYFDNVKMGVGFRADLIVEDEVIVEIKSIENLMPVHAKQLMTYLRLAGIPKGLLINFNEELLKHGIKRIVV